MGKWFHNKPTVLQYIIALGVPLFLFLYVVLTKNYSLCAVFWLGVFYTIILIMLEREK